MSNSCNLWFQVFKATVRQVEFFRKRVRQGFEVEIAHDFARYVQNSGLCELMVENPVLGDNSLHTERLQRIFPYDGAELLRQADALDAECCEYWRGHTKDSKGTAAGANKSDLEEIRHSLDLIAARLAGLESVTRVRVRKPKLSVVPKAGAVS